MLILHRTALVLVGTVILWGAVKDTRYDETSSVHCSCGFLHQSNKNETVFGKWWVSLIPECRVWMLSLFMLRWGQQPCWKWYPDLCLFNCCVLTLVPTVAPDMIHLNTDKWLSDQEVPETLGDGVRVGIWICEDENNNSGEFLSK